MGSIDAKKSTSTMSLSSENRWINVKQKHKNHLLITVYEHDGISHAELAKRLDILPSGLNGVLDKICEGCDSENSPLIYEKRNKYKYYHLTASGKQYVEEQLISVKGKESESELAAYWNSFQSKAEHASDERLEHFLEQYAKMEEEPKEKEVQDLINGFMDCLFSFYLSMPKDALGAMENIITSGKIREQIKTIVRDKIADRKIMEPLEKMITEKTKDGYQLLDSLWEHTLVRQSESIRTMGEGYDWEAVRRAMYKIESDMLRAIMNFQDAEYLRERWIRNGMNVHLAHYLAEKYKYLLLQYEWNREKRDSRDKKLQKY